MSVRLSVIVPTIGRASLVRLLDSLLPQTQAGDQVLVVGDLMTVADLMRVSRWAYADGRLLVVPCRPGHDWGAHERTVGLSHATGTHLVFGDDDDVFLPGALDAIRATVDDRPWMFRMVDPNGAVLWQTPEVRQGNHGTPQFVVPNDPARLGVWGTRYEGDFDFVVSTLAHYPADALQWSPSVIYACRDIAARAGLLAEVPA